MSTVLKNKRQNERQGKQKAGSGNLLAQECNVGSGNLTLEKEEEPIFSHSMLHVIISKQCRDKILNIRGPQQYAN